MAVDDLVILRIIGRLQSQNVVNNLAFQISAQVDTEAEILQALCDDWETAMESTWLGRHSEDYELVGLRAFNLTGDNKVPGLTAIGTNGAIVADALPATVCRTITIYTDSDNHRKRGRVMVSGTTAAHLSTTDGGVVAAEVALMQVLANALATVIGTGGNEFTPVVAGKDAGGAWEALTPIAWKARRTPSNITSRRIRELLIG